jgi:hypothetical protein
MDTQVISKQRVADHGEVLTHAREVNAMLDLVKNETERIDSRFLEPACGNGNFLAEILRRKLAVVEARYGQSQLEWERNAVLAVSSVYGIDILEDNVRDCRQRLFEIFDAVYAARFREQARDECRNAVRFLLGRNIIWGDALSLKTVGENSQPIIFSEWSPVNGSMMKRRDYMLSFLVEKTHQFSLFNDENEEASVPLPVQEFPLVHFLKLTDAE